MEGFHLGESVAIVVSFAVDQDRGDPDVTSAFDIGRRFVADVAGLLRRHTRPLQRFLEYAGIRLGGADHGRCQNVALIAFIVFIIPKSETCLQ